ncbi:MAG TPA: phosphoenolpyruvate--protein phosphotransferase [Anaerolineales bacterium]|nr:phosphoenolpyruvate--protein phosphotransferase [Anaerolineales bacterium]
MVGIVIVSHSRTLAEELVKLAKQVSEADFPIAFAGGAGPDHQEFGTDALDILEAVQSVYSEDGVLVLMDLGSAILSTELALELLPPEMRPNIRLSPCAIVEGAISAAVQSSLGSSVESVFAEAQRSLVAKSDHLSTPASAGYPTTSIPTAEPVAPSTELSLTLENEHGLHARPAARFVQLASSFEADILVRNPRTKKGPVPANSLNALATLGAVRGDTIVISASGPDSLPAIEALRVLVQNRFGEKISQSTSRQDEGPIPTPADAPPPGSGILAGIPVVEGVAIGPAQHFSPQPAAVRVQKAETPQQEWDQFEQARQAVLKGIEDRRLQMLARLGESEASIFEAHGLILGDPILLGAVRSAIFDEGLSASQSWDTAVRRAADEYRSLDDAYQRQRAQDVEDVGDQVQIRLSGEDSFAEFDFSEPVILLAQDLTPSQTARLDLEKIYGLITFGGGPASHSAILARALGIPFISGADPAAANLRAGTTLGLDSFEGLIYVEPDDEVRTRLEARRREWLDERANLRLASLLPAVTLDGHPVEVLANVGSLEDSRAASASGAEGIGLLRTEFLFLDRSIPPTEDEQFTVLSRIGEVMTGRPVTIRTLDVGGDKPLPFVEQEAEANPFLGVRAIRLTLRRPDLFTPHLRAILRAGGQFKARIMFPMVAGLEEFAQAKRMLGEAHAALLRDDIPHLWPIETGIMVETPAAAIMSPEFAAAADFFSIGTNDLTQYTLAAERGNYQLSDYQDGLNPAVLRLIERVTAAAHGQGIKVGICGELAGDIEAVPVLLGLGVDELSINPPGIPPVKALIRGLDILAARTLAAEARDSVSAAQVRVLVGGFMRSSPGFG